MKIFTERVSFPGRIKRTVEHLYTTKFGGSADALACTSLGLAFLGSTPSIAQHLLSTPLSSVPFLLAGSAGFWLTSRVNEYWSREKVFEGRLQIKSDKSPWEPEPDSQKVGGLLLGYTTDDGRPVFIDWEHFTRHVFILGQSGVGKTVAGSLLMFQQIQAGGGILFIDGKIDKSNIEMLWLFCAYCGRPHDLFVINTDDPDNSNTYNPILYGDPDEKADALLQQIPSTESNPGADFYKQEAKVGLTVLFRALQTANMAYNMIDITVLLMSGAAMLDLEKKLQNRAPTSEALKEFKLFLDKFRDKPTKENPKPSLNIDKLKNVFGGMAGRLYAFGTGKFGKILNSYDPDVKLFEAIRSNKVIYIALATMGKDATARNFGKLIISDLRTSISWLQRLPKNERPWPPFMAFCDEAGSYANESWSRIPEQARSAHVVFMPAAQTVANFTAISPELYQMVIGNAWNKIFFKVGTQESALEAQELVGKYMGTTKSLGGTISATESAAFLKSAPQRQEGESSGVSESEREQEAYHVTADDFKKMDKGECLYTWGDSLIYNLRVPMLTFSDELKARLGEHRINRFRKTGLKIDGHSVRPAGYFDNLDQYLSTSAIKNVLGDGHENQDEPPKAKAKQWASKSKSNAGNDDSVVALDYDE